MRVTAPVPMHTVAGFIPALIVARRRRPHVSMEAWRTVAAAPAAPGQRNVSAPLLCTLADDIERAQGAA